MRYNLTKWLSFCGSFDVLFTDTSFIEIGVCCQELLSQKSIFITGTLDTVLFKELVMMMCFMSNDTYVFVSVGLHNKG